MLTLRTVRRVCAAIDAIAVTIIVSNIAKSRRKSDITVASADYFPTIASCKAALLKAQSESYTNDSSNSTIVSVSEPAIVKLKKESDPEKLFHLFKSNATNRLIIENRFIFECTVSRLSKASRFDLIEQLLEHQKKLPQGRREGFIIRIIMLYGRAGMPDHARKTFEDMHLFGCPRNIKSFNALVKVLYENRRFDDIKEIYDKNRSEFGIGFDEISFNIIINALCKMGRLVDAYMAMVKMEEYGVKPDVFTYTILMSAFYKLGRQEIGDGLWNLMLYRGCSPTIATYNVRIQFLINDNKAWEANNLVRRMNFVGLKPNARTYNFIIKGFCKIHELEMAKDIFFGLHLRGCKPNSQIYQTMIHHLCKGGEFYTAFILCKYSMENNWYPNVSIIDRLLRGLMCISRDQNAREIMKLVTERKHGFSKGELKAFRDTILAST